MRWIRVGLCVLTWEALATEEGVDDRSGDGHGGGEGGECEGEAHVG
jgi:hypothetical protein